MWKLEVALFLFVEYIHKLDFLCSALALKTLKQKSRYQAPEDGNYYSLRKNPEFSTVLFQILMAIFNIYDVHHTYGAC